ncbi:MAG: trypsin-like peptidase domain-containing protein, partial [Planctomycetes bacterium]|nr:trypsin-like peptidase domain-containing protein [Planctomycetota bacterium]
MICTLLAGSMVIGASHRAAVASSLRRTAIVEAVERARPAVVNIQGRKTVRSEQVEATGADPFRQVNGMGTGIIIDGRGYILTNYHVIENVELIHVTLADRSEYVGQLVSNDPVSDLAIIRIETGSPLSVIDTGTSGDLMPGESVIAVGNAFGYEHTVTCGIISALHREVQVSAAQKYRDLIQTDASINPGNSGGPLLNIDGQMIGINVAVRVGAQGIGFAIPVDEALDIAAQLLSVERIDQVTHGVIGETRMQKGPGSFVVTE